MYWSLQNSPGGSSEPVSPSEHSAADDAASRKDVEADDASQPSQGENRA